MGSTVSTPRLVNIGVPQGSVLGPLFFLAYIDDLADSLKTSKASFFADDTALYCTASTAAESQLKLNEDLASELSLFRSRCLVLQNKAAKIILNKPVYSSTTSALASLGWKTLKVRRQFHRSLLF